MLQLKVRFKAICNNISSSNPATAIPQHLVDFFATLISDDNYFPPTFLYPFESSLFEHTKLGGTLNMLYQEDDSDTDKNISRQLLPYILTVEYNKHDSGSSDAGSVKVRYIKWMIQCSFYLLYTFVYPLFIAHNMPSMYTVCSCLAVIYDTHIGC